MEKSLLLIAHLFYCFRSPPLCAAVIPDCPDDCVCFNASRHVTCDGAGLTAIPVARLHGAVTSLDLSRNQLAVVDTLRGLGSLVELRLRQNRIGVLHRGALDYIAVSLEVLDLAENNLTRLEPGALNVATQLLHVDLSGNQLSDVDMSWNHLSEVDLSGNQLSDVNLSRNQLNNVDMSGNQLSEVDLSGNQLSDVDGAFDGLRRLSRLDLRRNRLTTVTSKTLSGLSGLRYLRLDDNRISSVADRAFATLDRLMYLVLRGNRLSTVSRFHFSSEFLSYVDLSDCGLEQFPSGLPGSVQYLQLRHNRLRTMSRRDLVDVAAELNILVLDENRLEHIDDDAFETTANLQQLWLNGNRLRAIPRSLPASLRRLFVDSNRLQSLTAADFPPPSSGAWQLDTLSAMSNNISLVSGDALTSLSQLSSVDLAANRIRKLHSDTFAGNGRLRTLTLSKNPLEELGVRCMRGLDKLETLSLAYIPTREVTLAEDAFGDRLPSLRRLDMTNSPGLIEALMRSDAALSALGAVQDLALLGSELESLGEDFPRVFHNLAVLHLSSSGWHCDASMRWFRNWLLSTAIHLEPARDQILCGSPQQVSGRAVISLHDEDFELPVDVAQRHPVSRRRPPSVILPTSSSSLNRAAMPTSPTRSYDREPLIWEDVLDRMPALYDDIDQKHQTAQPPRGNLFAPTTSGLSSSITGSRTNDRVILIIVMTVLVTALAAVAILAVIIHTCRKQPTTQPKNPTRTTTTGNGNASISAQNGCIVGSKTGQHFVYFVANGKPSPEVGRAKVNEGIKSNTVVEICDTMDCQRRVTLLPERNVDDKGPLRVYKWEDF